MSTLGISSWFGYDLPLENRLRLITQAGFSATSLWLGEEEEMVGSGQADLMPSLVCDHGLIIDYIHAPFRHCNLLWSDSSQNNRIIERDYQSAISFCYNHHIPIVVIHISHTKNPPLQTQNGIEIIRDLVEQAADAGVIIAIENTLRAEYLDAIFTNIQSAHLGFCYDSSHDHLPGQSRGGILDKWGDRLVTTHLSDTRGENDHLLPGRGEVDWIKITKLLSGKKYSGTLLLEVEKHETNTTPENYLKAAYFELTKIAETLARKR